MLGKYLKLGHTHFLWQPLQIIIYHLPTTGWYTAWLLIASLCILQINISWQLLKATSKQFKLTSRTEKGQRYYEIYSVLLPTCIMAMTVKKYPSIQVESLDLVHSKT